MKNLENPQHVCFVCFACFTTCSTYFVGSGAILSDELEIPASTNQICIQNQRTMARKQHKSEQGLVTLQKSSQSVYLSK